MINLTLQSLLQLQNLLIEGYFQILAKSTRKLAASTCVLSKVSIRTL